MTWMIKNLHRHIHFSGKSKNQVNWHPLAQRRVFLHRNTVALGLLLLFVRSLFSQGAHFLLCEILWEIYLTVCRAFVILVFQLSTQVKGMVLCFLTSFFYTWGEANRLTCTCVWPSYQNRHNHRGCLTALFAQDAITSLYLYIANSFFSYYIKN